MSEFFETVENIAKLYNNGALVVDARDPAEIERYGDAVEGTSCFAFLYVEVAND
jgi:hypothetical protein